jgi:Protein of unknown function (DUF3352)
MSKRSLVLILLALGLLGLLGYWFSRHPPGDGPAIGSLPPAQTLGFLALPGLPQAWKDVQQSQFYRHVSSAAFWQRALGQDGYQRAVAEKQQIEQRLGFPLTEQTMSLLLGREVGLALVPSQGPPWPYDVIAYIRVSDTEKIAETLARTFSAAMQDLVRETRSVDGIEIVTLRPKDGTTHVSYAFLGTLAVSSTDPAWVIDAIKSRQKPPQDRLPITTLFQAMPLETAEPLLAYGYYDVSRMQAQAAARMPGAAQPPPAGALSLLQTTDKVSLKASRVGNGVKVETMAWHPPNGASRIFRDAAHEGATPPFQGVPAETFYLTHIDLLNLHGLWHLYTQLAALSPQDRLGLEQRLAQFRARMGVDLERDVLPLLTGVGGLGITAPPGSQRRGPVALPGVFLTLGITDEAKVQQLLEAIGTHAGGPLYTEFLRRRPYNGHTIYYLDNPFLFVKPGYVISRQQLILASDVELLQHMLDAAAGKTLALFGTQTYRDLRKHFQVTGGSLTFVDMAMASEKARDTWSRLGFLIQALLPVGPGRPDAAARYANLSALLELLRPIRYIGAASQVESQGVRTEAFIVLEDLKSSGQ